MTNTLTEGCPIQGWSESSANLTDRAAPGELIDAVIEIASPRLWGPQGMSRLDAGMTDITEGLDVAPMWLKYLTMRLNEMAGRRDELEGLPPADPDAIRAALFFAHLHMPKKMSTPSVGTSPDGGVEFSWHESGWELEIEIDTSGEFVWARNRDSGETWEGSFRDLEDFVTELSGVFSR